MLKVLLVGASELGLAIARAMRDSGGWDLAAIARYVLDGL